MIYNNGYKTMAFEKKLYLFTKIEREIYFYITSLLYFMH